MQTDRDVGCYKYSSMQVYELSLPPISEILLKSFKGYNVDYNYIIDRNIKNIVRPEWETFLNLKWNSIYYFKKQNYTGSIHTDVCGPSNTTNLNNAVWGINWVMSGTCIMQFWKYEQVITIGITPTSINNESSGSVPMYKNLTKPYESHILKSGKAYLVNATLPHRAIGVGNRKVYSYRLHTDSYTLSWNNVVKLFNDYIISGTGH